MIACEICGALFSPRRKDHIYCTQRCSQQAWRERQGAVLRRRIPTASKPAPPPWPAHEVPVAIVAHPQRLAAARQLAGLTWAEAVIVDCDSAGATANHFRALQWLAGGNSPWSVVLEDDARPITDFRHQLHTLLAAAPCPVVSLYLGRNHPPHWQSKIATVIAPLDADPNFLVAPALLHGVGYAIRTDLLASLLERFDTRHPIVEDVISAWVRRRRLPVAHSRPSIVDHADGPSLVIPIDGIPRRQRTAWLCDGRQSWNSSVAIIPEPQIYSRGAVG